MDSSNLSVSDSLTVAVTEYVEKYMSKYDPSHDFNHIQRVVKLAQHIHEATSSETSREIVTLCALLHDVGDRKYLQPGEIASRLVYDALVSLGASAALAEKVQTICLGVSYSSEIKNPSHVVSLIEEHPELAIVQDADRLDAIGAVGIGRAFTFGGAKGRDMGNTMKHFEEKLVRLEGMMKTDKGREMARERTERIRLMQEWWADEAL